MPEETSAEAEKLSKRKINAPAKQSLAIRIKEEKIDPEIENKIKNEDAEKKINDKIQLNHSDEHTSDEDNTDSDTDSQEQEEDDAEEEEEEDKKKPLEPVKSSNEILMELFNVFNAAPPEELLDDKNLIQKTAQKRKKEKKKKHKKLKLEDDNCTLSGTETTAHGKHKKKKKHKHKLKEGDNPKENKKSKDKEKSKSKDKKSSKDHDNKSKHIDKKDGKKHSKKDSKEVRKNKDTHGIKSETSTTNRKRHHEKDAYVAHKREKIEDENIKHRHSNSNPFYSTTSYDEEIKAEPLDTGDKYCKTGGKIAIKIKKHFKESGRHKTSDGEISEISLSDEESYLRGKEKLSDYNKYKSRNSFYANTEKGRSSRERGNAGGYNKERNNTQDRDKDKEESRRRQRVREAAGGRSYHSRHHLNSRSRSRSRSRDLGIDKKRLLEIARKNAISMFKRGNLPGCANMTEDVKDRVLLKMRYGGRTVEDLTEFCKKISNGEQLSDLSSDEGSDIDKSGNVKAFHHPFQLKEREPIVMHIRNSKPIVPAAKTAEDTKAITMQFPVSSGQQHRMTEAWIPVDQKDKTPGMPALPSVSQSTNIFKAAAAKNALGKSLPTETKQLPAFTPVGDAVATVGSNNEVLAVPIVLPPVQKPVPLTFQSTPPEPPPPITTAPLPPPYIPPPVVASEAVSFVPKTFLPDVAVPSAVESIFPNNCASFDVSAIISKRLNAMRRLQDNPMDSEALKLMYNSQKEMSSWAASKHMPGQFTGSTGVNTLKPNELSGGPQVWVKKNLLTATKPVTGGMGMHLLQKMGWRPGEGLGRDKNGSLQPLLLDVKLDKRGLVAQEDIKQPKKRPHAHNGPPTTQNLQEKHPVCLLNELTTKYKWLAPLYTLVHENGPSHSRMFLFSVQVNNETYTPTKLSNTKKDAKLAAAKLCLQQMNILPPD